MNPTQSETLPPQPEARTTEDSDEVLQERSYGTYRLLFAVSLVFLCLVPTQASWVSTTRGWYTQPMLGSLLGLSIFSLFSLYRVIQSFRVKSSESTARNGNIIENAFEALESYRTALVASALFFVYIELLDVIGFMLATTLFVTTLLWMSRLLNRTWLISALLTVAALIFIFRFVLHIWLPDVWLYSLLPNDLADFANQYL
ncbi:tripartite tricarboxylate transporter TctB family protein [Marinobacter halodurans]|uniref:Tripartite tricarboxylate transporter TctB family protein n=1 Tax=Marinobacter halodurans TaxID=2528979 RepID=A0ABY1ZSY6_9GAMM|nr:tripartite tricarboxylate transporter TctB family protein [Marinobacter halodurans]TBW58175.1 tripartite tricarboxylate transporter TctB family protein [Marinobacter halodurans]